MEQSKHKHDNCSRHPQQAGGRGEHTQRSEQTSSMAHLRRSFPPPRDSIRNAALIPVPVACRFCQGGVSGPSGPDGASATAVLISPPAHVRVEQQQKRLVVFPRVALKRSENAQEISRQRALAGSG